MKLATALAFVVVASCGRAVAVKPPAAADREIDRYIEHEMQQQHIPALSYAIVRDGAIVASGARGLANVELGAPATGTTEFAIASMSKSMTASAVALLAQDGALSLDDPVSKYLPALPDAWRAMTIRQLLSHTAGVRDHFRDFEKYPPILDRHLDYTADEYLKAHIEAPLNFTPGSEWAYSGGGYVVLGAIIAKASGLPYAEYMRRRVFQPLAMEHTHIISLSDVIPDRASGYWFRDRALRNGGYTGPAHISGPDVAVMTTVTDFAKWMIAISTPRVWTAASRDQMWTPATLADGRDAGMLGNGYGLGFITGRDGRYRVVGHGGSLVNGFASTFMLVPDKRLGVVVLTNQYDSNPSRIALGLLGRIDPELRPPHELTPTRDPDPAATERARAFIAAVLAGGDLSAAATPGFARHMSAMAHPPVPPNAPPPPIMFVAAGELAPPLTVYGASAVRFAVYRIADHGEEHWITLYLSAAGQVANLSAY